MAEVSPQKDNPLRGILYMCATAIVMFPALNASVKYLSVDYSLVQIVWVRSVLHMAWMVVLFMPGRGWSLFIPNRPWLQFARSATQFIAVASYIVALSHIPLTTVTTIAFTAPLMVVALSVFMLGEQVGPRRWSAVAVGFIGAIVIIRPGHDDTHWSMFLVLVSAASYAIYQILTRKVAGQDDLGTTSVYTILVALVASSAAVPFFWETPVDLIDILIFLGLGFFGGVGHYLMIKAFEHGKASVVTPYDYGQLIGATILGLAFFNDFPDMWTWIGAAIIVGSGVYIARREAQVKAAGKRV
jgi:drug/metabolite transporter (DMT)-like permease